MHICTYICKQFNGVNKQTNKQKKDANKDSSLGFLKEFWKIFFHNILEKPVIEGMRTTIVAEDVQVRCGVKN